MRTRTSRTGSHRGELRTSARRLAALGHDPVWSPEAISDLVALRAYIAEDNPPAAQRIALHIIHNVEELLSANPNMGRPGRVPGTRELVIPKTPFIVPYRVQGETVQILRVFHGARRSPDGF